MNAKPIKFPIPVRARVRVANRPIPCYVCEYVITNQDVYFSVDNHDIHKSCLEEYLMKELKEVSNDR